MSLGMRFGRRLLAASLAVPIGLCAAEPLRFSTLTGEQGLSENTVRALVEDQQGFLWIGTEDGLNRYDGVEFKVFKAQAATPFGLAEDFINALHVDRQGHLWVGVFAGGLSRYDPRRGVFENFLHDPKDARSISHNDVSAIWESPKGTLWIGTQGGGLNRLDAASGKLQRIAWPANTDTVGLNQVRCLIGDGGEGLWIGTQSAGLAHFDPEQGSLIRHGADSSGAMALPSKEISALLLDQRRRLWIGTRRHGLLVVEGDAKQRAFRHAADDPGSLAHNAINRLYQDRDNRVWVATAGGLDEYDEGRQGFVHNRHDPARPYSLPYTDVLSVYQDSNGNLWAGTGGGGVARHAPQRGQFSVYQHGAGEPRGLSAGGVWSLLEDARETLWVGTIDGGLQFLPAGAEEFQTLRHAADGSGLSDNDVRTLLAVGDEQLWVGTRRGLNILDLGSGEVRQHFHDPAEPNSLANDFVRSLMRDSSGQIWVGTYGGGLDRYDAQSGSFQHLRHQRDDANSLSDDRVYSLQDDQQGSIWVGTHGGGLNRLDVAQQRWTRFRHVANDPHSISNDRILDLHKDAQGTLWVGSGAGLDRYDATRGRFERQRGLLGHVIYGIAEDSAGRFWLSTNDGVERFDPANGEVRRFPLDGLMRNPEFNGGAHFRGASGRIYFGGVDGVLVIDPSVVDTDTSSVTPILTDLLLFNRPARLAAYDDSSPLTQPIEFMTQIELDHTQSVFGFAFAALKAANPGRHAFAYRLDGLYDAWIDAAPRQRMATFTNVSPGDYLFRVRTTDANGTWLPREARLRVVIRPAPWLSPWAKLAYLAAVGALIAWWTWRRHVRKRQRGVAQRLLRDSEERLSLALWGSGDELIDWNLANGQLLRMKGERGAETRVFEGLHAIDDLQPYVHADDYPGLRQALAEHFAGRSDHFEAACRLRALSGDWVWRLMRGRVVARDAGAAPLRVTGTQNDIGAIKAAESELRELNASLDARVQERTEEIRQRQHVLERTIQVLRQTQSELIESEKMASLGRLVAGVAHEINTPLGVGVTAVSFLRERLGAVTAALRRQLSPQETAELVEPLTSATTMLETNVQRAAALVKTFKQVAVDQSKTDLRSMGLRANLEATLESLHSVLKKTGHSVVLQCDEQIVISSRPDALFQIVVHLVNNSLTHAFPGGGKGNISILAAVDSDTVKLRYADDGVGMSADVVEHVFEPFFTTRRRHGGTGLGMHIAYNLVTQALAGRITCSSEPGQGVRFDIEFPRVHPHAEQAQG